MSTEPTRTPATDDLLRDVTTYIEATEHERRELEGSVANLRVRLAAAEKRAEVAETRLARLTGVCRHGACGDPPLESGYCREHEAAFAVAPAQPQKPTRAANEPIYSETAADDAEARRDARRDYP